MIVLNLYYLYYSQSIKMNGPIQPWRDQNSHIPHKLFHSKKKLNKQKDQFMKKLRKTEWSFKTRTKTEYN